jgi:DNA-binding NarL/FixJ family response regulator
MRVVIADDEVLLREGLARLLTEVGVQVVALVGDQPSLERAVALDGPHVAIVDIKMPPTHTDEGLVAAAEIRRQHPEVGVLLLSHYLDSRYAVGPTRTALRRRRLPPQGASFEHPCLGRRTAARSRR